ncbi:hypothetical protein CAEBREN_16795 [Caenorhabditis brenneri]|uniref:SPK domain-containing protein n=1 Tax=Caenorhabditis brenneri TaxID=135651 RepID=G0PMM6_CAEBE|nr:hypothetical protein CAEBREN_16795 [Caenorhabditis brenneri]
MQQRSDVCRSLFEWILENKWECQSPCPFTELYKEVVGALLQRKQIRGFTIYQEIHLNFILNVPLNPALLNDAKKFGRLKQVNGYIIEFNSNDGNFQRVGTPFPRYGNHDKIQERTSYWQGTEDDYETSGNSVTIGYEEATPNRQALYQEVSPQRRRSIDGTST